MKLGENMIWKIIYSILCLFTVICFVQCDDTQTQNPEPTPTPGYCDIQCQKIIICEDASTWTDYRVRNGAYFQNYGTIAGFAIAELSVQQPHYNTIGTWQQEIYLSPGEYVWLEHTFSEPIWNSEDVWCSCNVY